ncbi:MAG: phosphorylase family protein [Candidatus Dormibacteria bacterium]
MAATALEARPLRRRLGGRDGVAVRRCGVGARDWTSWDGTATVLSCGLAGGLDTALAPGTLLIPAVVATPGRPPRACDPELVERLRAAAHVCGLTAQGGTLVTLDHVVRGRERERWAGRGFSAVDMESAILAAAAPRFAAVRVVLDTPARELGGDWQRPGRALADPRNWREALWLARVAPGHCALVAEVVDAALA